MVLDAVGPDLVMPSNKGHDVGSVGLVIDGTTAAMIPATSSAALPAPVRDSVVHTQIGYMSSTSDKQNDHTTCWPGVLRDTPTTKSLQN